MPIAPKPLHYGGTKAATKEGRRKNSHERGYTRRYYKRTEAFRTEQPLCERCLERGNVVPGPHLDHIIPHRGNEELLNDPANWQALCHHCHSLKTHWENQGVLIFITDRCLGCVTIPPTFTYAPLKEDDGTPLQATG